MIYNPAGDTIRIFDLETTGEGDDAAVLEVGFCDLMVKSRDLAGTPLMFAVVGLPGSFLTNPGQPISPETSAVHHLIDEDVAHAPPWREAIASKHPARIIALGAHSAKFERVFLTDEVTGGLPWLDTYKAACRLWPDAPSFGNQALRYWRRPEGLDRAASMPAHRAGPDAYVTAHILRDQLNQLAEQGCPDPIAQIIDWSAKPALLPRCWIGKDWRGYRWSEVEFSFLEWISARDFDEDVMFTVRYEMHRRREAYKKRIEADREAAVNIAPGPGRDG